MAVSRRPRWPTVLIVVAALLAGCDLLTPAAPEGPAVAEPRGIVRRVDPVDQPPDQRPNILLITTDDQNAGDLRWMPRTRRLLGEAGTTFTDAISAHPLCCPARAQLLTGQYAHNNGVRHNHGPWGGFKRLRTGQTVATWLSDAGYRTAFVGKFLNEYPQFGRRPAGWTVWDPILTKWYAYFGTTFKRPGPGGADDYVVDAVARRTERYLRRLADSDKPFFVWASHVAPHATMKSPGVWSPPRAAKRHRDDVTRLRARSVDDPAFATPPIGDADLVGQRPGGSVDYYDRYHRQRIRTLLAVDEAVAANLRVLDTLGELDDTVVIFTSDNGYLLGEHGLVGKSVLYRQALEIPLLMRGPGAPPGETREATVTLADVATTVVDLADADPGLRLDGRSVLPLLADSDASWRDTTLLLTGSERTWGPAPGWGYRGVRTDRYTFGLDARTGEPLLFDRLRDPAELHDVAADPAYRGVVRDLTQRAHALIGCQGPACNRTFGRVGDAPIRGSGSPASPRGR